MVSIYFLKLRSGKYYIGKTKNIYFRINDHINKNGSEWTKLYNPIDIYYIKYNCDDFDEDKYTKMAMATFGIDNVRGGSYCSIRLSDQDKKYLLKEIRGTTNACFKCGSYNHFVNKCKEHISNKENICIICFKCCDYGHYTHKCTIENDHKEIIINPPFVLLTLCIIIGIILTILYKF